MSDLSELQRRTGRPCRACSHPRRSELEAELLSGERTLSSVSSEFELSLAGARRHRAAHMAWTRQQAIDAGLTSGEVAQQLLDLAERLDDALSEAEESHDRPNTARLALARERVLRSLLDRSLKVETIELLGDQRAYLYAIQAAIRERPELGEGMARHFRAVGVTNVARTLEDFVSRNRELSA